jgi:hypothetical protein
MNYSKEALKIYTIIREIKEDKIIKYEISDKY